MVEILLFILVAILVIYQTQFSIIYCCNNKWQHLNQSLKCIIEIRLDLQKNNNTMHKRRLRAQIIELKKYVQEKGVFTFWQVTRTIFWMIECMINFNLKHLLRPINKFLLWSFANVLCTLCHNTVLVVLNWMREWPEIIYKTFVFSSINHLKWWFVRVNGHFHMCTI